MWLSYLIILSFVLAVMALVRAWIDHAQGKARIADLEKALQAAQKLTQLRGHLAHEVAHEIKNPIAAILCSAQTLDLLIGKDLKAEHRLTLHYIKEYSEHLLQLCGDFLDISMSESGLLKPKPVVFNVKTNIESIVGLLESNAEQKSITLKILSVAQDLEVKLDAKHFKQIIFNLLHNAIQYTPKGGEVQILIEPDFSLAAAKISIKDNGPGIESEKISQIFDPYARLDNPQREKTSGLGLGLALCNNFVKLAGGSIEVQSQPDVGSCFIVRLPLYVSNESLVATSTELVTDSPSSTVLKQKYLAH